MYTEGVRHSMRREGHHRDSDRSLRESDRSRRESYKLFRDLEGHHRDPDKTHRDGDKSHKSRKGTEKSHNGVTEKIQRNIVMYPRIGIRKARKEVKHPRDIEKSINTGVKNSTKKIIYLLKPLVRLSKLRVIYLKSMNL